MGMKRRMKVEHGDVFPNGAYLVDEVSPVADYDAEPRSDGTRPQSKDKETGLPVWSCTVVDADPEVGKRDRTISVKVSADVQPVPPANNTDSPFTLVEFEGLTATPWVDDSGPRARLAWSLRATGITEPKRGKGATDGSGTTRSGVSASSTDNTGSGGNKAVA